MHNWPCPDAYFGGRNNTSGRGTSAEILFNNFTTLHKILKIISVYIKVCHFMNVNTNVMINVKRFLRINQDICTQSFQTVPRWKDAGYLNEWFAARLYCGNISRRNLIIIKIYCLTRQVEFRHNMTGRLFDIRSEVYWLLCRTFSKPSCQRTIARKQASTFASQ